MLIGPLGYFSFRHERDMRMAGTGRQLPEQMGPCLITLNIPTGVRDGPIWLSSEPNWCVVGGEGSTAPICI